MIYLFTGAPGTYKTYSAIAFAKELAGESRRVYVSGVTELKVPGWQQLDRDGVRDWKQQLPDGAILLCDEVSDLVPQRIKGDVPDWVNDLRTHRHKGLDLIFVTQHPMDVDVVFRRLVGEHRHFFRQFGIRRVSFLRGDSCDDAPDPANPKPGQVIERRQVDKDIFTLYRSTVLDTHKVRVPRKVLYGFLFFAAAGLFAWWMIGGMGERWTDGEGVADVKAETHQQTATLPSELQLGVEGERPQCIMWSNDPNSCQCFNQQGSRMRSIGLAQCNDIVRYGYYDPTIEQGFDG